MTLTASAGTIQPDAIIPFKTTVQTTLYLHVFVPENHTTNDMRPCIVFFFGGGWYKGTPEHFYRQSTYLAKRGMVAVCPEYRVKSVHGTTPFECVEDGKSAMRYVRAHAKKLGIDPNRIAAGGGSAGGHVAAACAFVNDFNARTDDLSVSPVPNALVLFNPVIDNGPGGFAHDSVKEKWRDFSPMHNIGASPPPMIFFLGTEDRHVPVATACETAERYRAHNGRCELRIYQDQPHGFFNYKKDNDPFFLDTVREMDKFLNSLGYIKGEPKIVKSSVTHITHPQKTIGKQEE